MPFREYKGSAGGWKQGVGSPQASKNGRDLVVDHRQPVVLPDLGQGSGRRELVHAQLQGELHAVCRHIVPILQA